MDTKKMIKSMMRDSDGVVRKGVVMAQKHEKAGRKIKNDLRKVRNEYRVR